ncbi:conserved exported hypothetical protein [Bradyrhizobium sp. ORS 375]|uniref:hypothetical protein n=1 Tax=Bradyrhizobium sp. (strain ORS 375) TaxID=566679 RepID=UPI0002407F7C|nr:hypothetical protein [Bradyrhizobium sp. ORS 375]CCD90863.1 conserved exported hypothetical protein [Bradyrhizobium sp. ORS 375]
MRTSIAKTWLGIGVVTIVVLLASSAATSPAIAASFGVDASGSVTATDSGPRKHPRSSRATKSIAMPPRYYGRPVDYVPAYPWGPFVLFTPFLD